jgi:hypothetical protein
VNTKGENDVSREAEGRINWLLENLTRKQLAVAAGNLLSASGVDRCATIELIRPLEEGDREELLAQLETLLEEPEVSW